MITQETIGEQISLTEDEHGLLIYIYRKRLRLFIIIYLFLSGVAFLSALSIDGNKTRLKYIHRKGNNYQYNERRTGLSRIQMYVVTISLFESFVIGIAIFIYRKRIGPIKKDARNGIKETIYYPVTQKQNFQQTAQYFIRTNHPDYLFHEVEYETWQQVNVGDHFAVYRAPLSKYVFNSKGRYNII